MADSPDLRVGYLVSDRGCSSPPSLVTPNTGQPETARWLHNLPAWLPEISSGKLSLFSFPTDSLFQLCLPELHPVPEVLSGSCSLGFCGMAFVPRD